jgi:outer membrane protein assembly factor BamB
MYVFDAAGNRACSGTPKTCTPLWVAPTNDLIFSTPLVANGVAYVGAAGRLWAFDASGKTGCGGTAPKTCAPLWTGMTLGGVFSSAAIGNGFVYVGSEDSMLYAFDPAGVKNCSGPAPPTCHPIWRGATNNAIDSSPAVANGVVFVEANNGAVYAFDAAGQKQCHGAPRVCAALWVRSTGGVGFSSPAVAGGAVFVGSGDKKLWAWTLP